MGLSKITIELPCSVGDRFWIKAYSGKNRRNVQVECIGYTVAVDIPNVIDTKIIWVSSIENPHDYWKVDADDFHNFCFETEELLRKNYTSFNEVKY